MRQHVIQLPIFHAKLMTNHGRRDMAAMQIVELWRIHLWNTLIGENPPKKHFDDTVNILFIYC